MGLWAEFKEFAIKGNVIDLAVGVIIGGAFGKITTSLVNDVVMPPIGVLLGGSDMAKKELVLRPEVKDAAGKVVDQGASLKYGAFVNTIFDFVLIAVVIFVLIKVINYARRSGPAAPEPTKSELLLTEIRDLLKQRDAPSR
jgi:large conductance mechanosensitive channel